MVPGADRIQQRKTLEARMGNIVVEMERAQVEAQDKQTAYHTNMMMVAAYPGISLLMMQEDYAVVQRNPLEMMLQSLGLVATTKCMLVFGDRWYAALSETILWIKTSMRRVKMLIYYLRELNKVGKIMTNLLAHHQLKTMTGVPILQSNYDAFRHLITNGWIKNVWKGLSEAQGEL